MSSSVAVSSVTIDGIVGNIYLQEYSGSKVFAAYTAAVKQLSDALFVQPTTPGAAPPPMDFIRREQAENAISKLRDIFKNGVDTPDGTEYITQDMANQLGIMFQSLRLVGVDTKASRFDFGTLEKAQVWQNLVASSLILTGLFNVAAEGNHSLQAMVELSYVKTANNVLSEQLSSLEEALQRTQTILDNLTSLQSLHNQITIPNAGPFPSTGLNAFTYDGQGFPQPPTPQSVKDFAKAYAAAASAHFSKPITPLVNFLPTDSGTITYEQATIPANSQIQPIADSGLISRILSLNQPAGQPGNLPANLQTGQPIFARWNAGNNSYDLYKEANGVWSDALTPGAHLYQNVTFPGGPTGQDFSFILGPASFPGYPNLDLITKYGLVQQTSNTSGGTIKIGAGSPISGISMYRTSGAGTGSALFDDFHASNLIQPNVVHLSDTFIGVQNAGTDPQLAIAISKINSDYAITGAMIQNVLVNTTGFATVWIGQTLDTGAFKIDATHNPQDFLTQRDSFIAIRSALSAQASALAAISPGSATDTNSLLHRLQDVLKDIHTTFVTTSGDITRNTSLQSSIAGMTKWMIDNYTTVGSSAATGNTSGAFQQNITFAVTATQSLNDNQKENVRNFLFVFEEYYKSASAVLQKLTQMLERIAQGVSGR